MRMRGAGRQAIIVAAPVSAGGRGQRLNDRQRPLIDLTSRGRGSGGNWLMRGLAAASRTGTGEILQRALGSIRQVGKLVFLGGRQTGAAPCAGAHLNVVAATGLRARRKPGEAGQQC